MQPFASSCRSSQFHASRQGLGGSAGDLQLYGNPDLELTEFRRMGDAQALARLADEPSDAFGLIVLYQKHRMDLKDAVIQHMRVDPRIYRRAIINVLLGVARHAHEYDPGVMHASEWIKCAAISEACRLRQALDQKQ